MDINFTKILRNTFLRFLSSRRTLKMISTETNDRCSGNVYIRNLPPFADKEYVLKYFGCFGRIISAKVILNPKTGESRGYGFVRFEHVGDALTAIKCMNCRKIDGYELLVKETTSQENYGFPSRCVLVKSVPSDITAIDVRFKFGDIGRICAVFTQCTLTTGTVYIQYETVEQASACIMMFDNVKYRQDLWPMQIKYVQPPRAIREMCQITVEKPKKKNSEGNIPEQSIRLNIDDLHHDREYDNLNFHLLLGDE